MEVLPLTNDRSQCPLGWVCDEQGDAKARQEKRSAECYSLSALEKRYELNPCPFTSARSVIPARTTWTTTVARQVGPLKLVSYTFTLSDPSIPSSQASSTSTGLSKREFPSKSTWKTTIVYNLPFLRQTTKTLTIPGSPSTSQTSSTGTGHSRRGRYVDPGRPIAREAVAPVITMDPGSKEASALFYNAEDAATPQKPVGAPAGHSSKATWPYRMNPMVSIFAAAIVGLFVFVFGSWVIWKKVQRRREVKKQMKRKGYVEEVVW